MPHASTECGCPQCRGALSANLSASAQSAAQSSKAASVGVYYIDALLAEGGDAHWNATVGTAVSVSYSFLTSLPAAYYGEEESVGFAAFNSTQRSAARAALALWAEVANVTFTETTGALGDIRFGTAYLSPSASAWAYYPGAGTGGDVWINNYYQSNATPVSGNYAFGTLVHELGHALGLKHPGDYNAGGGGTDGPYLPAAEDSTQYTAMSYNDHPTVTAVDVSMPMLYDIAAVQYLYGANTSTRSGDSVYSWGVNETVLQALWDGGGTDVIDVSNQTTSQTVDLRAGYFSSIAGQANNIAIAYGVVIESVLGGTAADRLIGNAYANTLSGGAGDDALESGGGNDTLIGGAGADWVTLGDAGGTVSVRSVETLRGGGGTDIVALGGAGNSIIVARLEALTGSTGGDWITLTNIGHTMTVSSVETLRGGAGVDVVTLGGVGNSMIVAGLETLIGSTSGDWITLSNIGHAMTVTGIETLRGGAGVDVITLSGSGNSMIVAGLETLTGSTSGDWITLSNIGHAMTVTGIETLRGGAGADAITLGGAGNSMIVAGLETLIGGAGTDVITLSNIGTTLNVASVESLTGGGAADMAVVTGGDIRFQGGAGADTLVLQTGAGADAVVFSQLTDGGALGASAGFDLVLNFQAAIDRVLLTGALRTSVDDNGDTLLAAASRGSGAVNLLTDEIARLTTTTAQLDDAGFAAFRTALGSLAGTAAGAGSLVLATDGTSSGLYHVVDAEGNGVIAAGEVRLLAKFNGAVLSAGNVFFG